MPDEAEDGSAPVEVTTAATSFVFSNASTRTIDAPFPPTTKKSKSTSTRHAATHLLVTSAPDPPLPRETRGQGPREAPGQPVGGSFGPPGVRRPSAPLGIGRRTPTRGKAV